MQKLRSKSGANMVNANLPQIYSPVFELLLRIAKSIYLCKFIFVVRCKLTGVKFVCTWNLLSRH